MSSVEVEALQAGLDELERLIGKIRDVSIPTFLAQIAELRRLIAGDTSTSVRSGESGQAVLPQLTAIVVDRGEPRHQERGHG